MGKEHTKRSHLGRRPSCSGSKSARALMFDSKPAVDIVGYCEKTVGDAACMFCCCRKQTVANSAADLSVLYAVIDYGRIQAQAYITPRQGPCSLVNMHPINVEMHEFMSQ
jgi:hypothetical protein